MDTANRLENVQAAMEKSWATDLRGRIAALAILSAAKPHIANLSGFSRLGDIIAGTEGVSYWNRTQCQYSRITHSFPRDISEETFVRHSGVLASTSGITERKLFRRSRERRWSHQKMLLVSRAGDVLIWDLTVRHVRRGKRCCATVMSKFRALERGALLTYLGNPQVSRALIASLGWAASETIERQLPCDAAIKELDTFIVGVENMLPLIADIS